MKLDRLYIDDKGSLRTTEKSPKKRDSTNKRGTAREVEIYANLIHRPPTAMRMNPMKDIKIPNV